MPNLDPTDKLLPGYLFVQPIDVPGGWDTTEMLDDEWQYFEAVDYADDERTNGHTVTLIIRNVGVFGIVIDGVHYSADQWDDYAEPLTDDDGDFGGAIDSESWDAIFGGTVDDIAEHSEGPMMNYIYPLDMLAEDPSLYAAKLRDLPLCVVERNGVWGLALTGGGMDLTWEICAAYMVCGALPPLHYARDLPAMGGRERDGADSSAIIDACIEAMARATESIDHDRQRLIERYARPTHFRTA